MVALTIMRDFAFCCAYQPGGGSEDVLFNYLEEILGSKPVGASASNYRRLFFESHALALKDLQSRMERSDNSEMKILPLAEKVQRLGEVHVSLFVAGAASCVSHFEAGAAFGEFMCHFFWQVHHLVKFMCHFLWQVQHLVKFMCHFLWQVQHLVKFMCHFSWQVQHLVKFMCRFSWQVQHLV